MAEPGDPTTPPTTEPPHPARDHDDLIGFSSAAALQGRPRVVAASEPEPGPEPEPEPALEPHSVPKPDSPSVPDPIVPREPDLFDAPIIDAPVVETSAPPPEPDPEPPAPEILTADEPRRPEPPLPIEPSPIPAAAKPTPTWAIETPVDPAPVRTRGRPVEPPRDVENATNLYAVYALVLFAVPTLGVSALIALLAVTGRSGPSNPVAASHFVFQQRTLWTGGIVALLGAILIAVGLGVFVLFVVAVWLILRGTSGVLALKAGRAVRDPRSWFLA